MTNLFLLTWNPDNSMMDWSGDSQKMLNGHRNHRSWSTGGRKKGIQVGDRLFLLRQRKDRGIIASGHATKEIFQAAHWDDTPRKKGNYVGVRWEKTTTIDYRLATEDLKRMFPKAGWAPMGSGTQVDPLYAERVWETWLHHLESIKSTKHSLPAEEIGESETAFEGAKTKVTVNRYERSPAARRLCIEVHGTTCVICDFNFEETYGEIGEGFIHVHHLVSLSAVKKEYEINGATDLRPVCPNCHAMLHRKRPAVMGIKALKNRLKK